MQYEILSKHGQSKFVNNFSAVQNLKIALIKANILQPTKNFSSNTLQSMKCQNKGAQIGIYFHLDPYSDVLYSEERQTKKLLVCC